MAIVARFRELVSQFLGAHTGRRRHHLPPGNYSTKAGRSFPPPPFHPSHNVGKHGYLLPNGQSFFTSLALNNLATGSGNEIIATVDLVLNCASNCINRHRRQEQALCVASAEGTTAQPTRRYHVDVDIRRWTDTPAAMEEPLTVCWTCFKHGSGLRGREGRYRNPLRLRCSVQLRRFDRTPGRTNGDTSESILVNGTERI